ncbi:RAD52 motif-containing protein 1 [Armadillidium vulgare]|nr:RAD52 motif-containing protein 1 [Armadillidium vulgare]
MKKVKIMKMPRDNFQSLFLKLNSHAMEELIVFYFGFNYWSLRVMDLQSVETNENEKEVKFICMVKVTTKDGLISEGIGVGKAPLTINHPGLVITAYRTARKFAVENAKADALSKFVIIELSNGKRLMDVNYQRPDQIPIRTRRDEVCCEVRNLCSDPEEDSFYHFDESEWIENLSDTQLDHLLENS